MVNVNKTSFKYTVNKGRNKQYNYLKYLFKRRMKKVEKISLREKLSYGVGSLGKDLYTGMFSIYLMVFLTDVFGISPVAVGTLMVVARLWDAINDPIMGVIVDRTNTRLGKFKPYILFVPFIMGASMIGLFTVPNLGSLGKLIWAYVFYIAAGMSFTAYDVPIMSMAPAISNDPNERTSLLAITRTFSMLGVLLVAVITLPLVGVLGAGDTAKGYQLFTIILVVISIVSAWIAYFNTKERNTVKGQKNSFKDYVELMKTNKPLLLVIGIFILNNIGFNLMGGAQIYYYSYVLGRADLIPVLMMFGFISIFVYPIIPMLAKKIGKIRLTTISFIISIISTSLIFFVGQNLSIFITLFVIRSIASAVPNVTLIVMIADTVDYGEWKTGVRSEGVIFSMNSFATKLGMAIGTGLVGFTLGFVGYVPNVAQSATALSGISLMFTLIPAVFIIISLILLSKYELTEEKAKEIGSELDIRRKA